MTGVTVAYAANAVRVGGPQRGLPVSSPDEESAGSGSRCRLPGSWHWPICARPHGRVPRPDLDSADGWACIQLHCHGR